MSIDPAALLSKAVGLLNMAQAPIDPERRKRYIEAARRLIDAAEALEGIGQEDRAR